MEMTARLPLCASALALAVAGLSASAADRALVVGIDDYAALGTDLAALHATTDARAFQTFLTDSWGFAPEDITLLTDSAATSDAIMSAMIDKLVGETATGDRVVFYFAGLGSQIDDRTGTEPDGMTEVLLAHDAASLLGKMPKDAVADILDIIADRDVTVIIDASHSGDAGITAATGGALATRGTGTAVTVSDETVEPPFGSGAAGRTIWTAAAPGQFAWETDAGGLFTDSLIEGVATGMADANENGTISNAELLSFLRDRSADWCQTTPECAATGLGLAPHFAGPIEGVAGKTMAAPEAPPQPPQGPKLTADGKPVSFAETLGFVTDLFTPSNSANLTLDLSNGGALKIGDVVSFSVAAERPGTLVLIDVNPKGELAQIFPSTLSADGSTRMTAGQTLVIPNGLSANGNPLQIRVTEPAGEGFLLALFIEDDLPKLTAILPENLSGGPIPNAGQYLYEIAQDLLQLQANASGKAAVEWSAAYLPYKIEP
jgi:hypothetical protein